MAEFVNLNQEDDSLNIIVYNPTSINNVKLDTPILDDDFINTDSSEVLYTIDSVSPPIPEEVEYEDCNSCDVSKFYGNTNSDDSFKRENLFSELVTEYQRAIARQNLGIADEYSLLWGNISGNLANQTDLHDYLNNTIALLVNYVVDDINSKLAQWAYEIRVALDQKANIISPNLLGIPTTTLPSTSNNSKQIASTEWVNAKIAESSNIDLNWLSLSSDYKFIGDPPVNVTCTWNYKQSVESQTINGVALPIDSRSYVFEGVDNSFIATLTYTINGIVNTKSVMFTTHHPIFYGNVLNHTQLDKTKDYSIVLNCDNEEYAYLYIPNGNNVRIAVDNIVGGFRNVGTISLLGITYYIYQSVNSGLGKLYINIL